MKNNNIYQNKYQTNLTVQQLTLSNFAISKAFRGLYVQETMGFMLQLGWTQNALPLVNWKKDVNIWWTIRIDLKLPYKKHS